MRTRLREMSTWYRVTDLSPCPPSRLVRAELAPWLLLGQKVKITLRFVKFFCRIIIVPLLKFFIARKTRSFDHHKHNGSLDGLALNGTLGLRCTPAMYTLFIIRTIINRQTGNCQRKYWSGSFYLSVTSYMGDANVTTSELTIHSRQLHRQPRCRILANIFEILRASEMISPCRSVFGNYRAIRLAPALSYPNGDGCSLNSKL